MRFGGSFKIPGVGLRVSTSMFFDRKAVKDALSRMDYDALMKASLIVKDRAKRIIHKKGMARLPTKVTDRFPGASLSALVQMKVITERTRNTIVREVQRPKGSPAGSPPFTHTPYSGYQTSFLGFRRNLWNFYDEQTHSAVVGPSKKGRQIPYLHEFGGAMGLRTWVFIPQIKTKRGGMKSPIVMKLPVGQSPHDLSRWRPLGDVEGVVYPQRPFMKPAMEWAVSTGRIAKAFQGAFRTSSGSGSGFTVRRG